MTFYVYGGERPNPSCQGTVPRRPAKTVADLIRHLQRMPPEAPVIGVRCEPLNVAPQTTGAVLIVD